MARNASQSQVHARGFGDIIGIVLISIAVLTLVAFFSYDKKDVPANATDTNPSTLNWIGPVGAWLGYAAFFAFGAGAYLLPILLFCFGLSYLFQLMAYFHRRWIWALVLVLCCIGLIDLNTIHVTLAGLRTTTQAASAGARPNATHAAFLDRIASNLNAPGAGGWIGLMMNRYLFGHFGSVGATIIFATLYLISLLFLTNFRLGEWLRALLKPQPAEPEKNLQEKALERRARELERQAKKLQEQVANAGLGADLQPVPEPTVRDLSVPQTKPPFRSSVRPGSKAAATATDQPPPGAEGDVISATEITAATTEEVLGRPKDKEKSREPRTDEPVAELSKNKDAARDLQTGENSDLVGPLVVQSPEAPSKPKAPQRKSKPITVASTPLIGNYQLPALDLLNYPDPAIRPTESREELMANARLIQQTLAQFE